MSEKRKRVSQADADPTTPHSLEAEKAVLGAVLVQPHQLTEVGSVLVAEHFFRDAHQRIYRAMWRLAAAGARIDSVTLNDALGAELETVGGPAYVASLLDGVPRSSNAPHYAAIVREKARLREVIETADRLRKEAYGQSTPSPEIVEAGVQALLGMADPGEQDAESLGTVIGRYVEQATGPGDDRSVYPTGFRDLDEMLAGGLRPADLMIVAARPSVGKTSFGLEVGYHIARRLGPTVFFSLEMAARALAARVTAWESRVPTSKVEARMHSGDDLRRMASAAEAAQGVPLTLVTSAHNLTQVSAWCHRLRQRDGLLAVVVDYAQLLIPDTKDRQQAATAVSRGLKRLGQDHNVPVVALSQLSRAPEARQDKRPQMADLRESGSFEQDADIVVLLYRAEMHKPTEDNRGIAEVILAKQRNGPTGVVKMAWLAELTQFTDLALGW